MKENPKGELYDLGKRLEASRERLNLPRAVDEDVEIARAIVTTLASFIDGGEVPERLQNAVAHQIAAVRRRKGKWSDPVEVVRGPRSGLGGTRRGQPTRRTW